MSKSVTWVLCVRVEPEEIDHSTFFVEWYPSGNIPRDWYPVEPYTQPIETVKQFAEGQRP